MKNKVIFLIVFALLVNMNRVCAQSIEWSKKANPAFNSINGVAFNSTGSKVLSGTNCHPASIRIFDVNTGTMTWDYEVGSDFMCIMGVSFSTNLNYVAAIEEFGNILLFDNSGSSPVIIDTINTETSYGFSIAISPNNEMIAVGCSNSKLKVYRIVDGLLTIDINAHAGWVTTVAYSPDGTKLVTGGNDDKVKVFDSEGLLLHTLSGHTGDITQVKISPDNNYIISASKDDKIKIWNLSTGELVQTLLGHSKDVNSIDLSFDGNKIVSASSDSTCKIWNFSSGELITTFGVVDSGAVTSIAWSPMGDKIVTGNINSDVVLWNISNTLGINKKASSSESTILIFPNPSSEHIQLLNTQNIDVQMIEIYDTKGKLMYRTNIWTNFIPISNYPSGIYFTKIQTNNNQPIIQSFFKN